MLSRNTDKTMVDLGPGPNPFHPPSLRGAVSLSAIALALGGGFFELACHILDAAMYVLGSKPDKAQGFNLRTQKSSGDSFADNQLVVLRYPRATATLR